ncbi:MAG: TMEM165/GDT1 family protein, partial [bacterium]
MYWRVLITTFGAVFFAELADKTQLVGIGLASKTGKPLSVW